MRVGDTAKLKEEHKDFWRYENFPETFKIVKINLIVEFDGINQGERIQKHLNGAHVEIVKGERE